MTKNCPRCGKNFDYIVRGERICTSCRKPIVYTSKPNLLGDHLSFREKQVAEKISEAKSNKEIAFELSLSAGTIKQYIFHIMAKTGCINRVDLAIQWLNGQLDQRAA